LLRVELADDARPDVQPSQRLRRHLHALARPRADKQDATRVGCRRREVDIEDAVRQRIGNDAEITRLDPQPAT
jgi:hypothetical protein